jgi:hypothetical protein
MCQPTILFGGNFDKTASVAVGLSNPFSPLTLDEIRIAALPGAAAGFVGF